jgi:hypothetical protein
VSYGWIILLNLLSVIYPQAVQRRPQYTASAGFTIIQEQDCIAGIASSCTTGSGTWGSGHLLIAWAGECAGSGCNSGPGVGKPVVTDSGGSNTWVEATATLVNQTGSGGYTSEFWYVCNSAAGTYTVTNTPTTATVDDPFVLVAEVSGVTTSSCLDAATPVTGAATGANPSITSGTVGQASEFFVMGLMDAVTTITPAQTLIVKTLSNVRVAASWTTGPASGTQNMSWTVASGKWTGAVTGFKHP